MPAASGAAIAARRLAIEYVPLEQLQLDPANARVHNKRQVKQIAASITSFGFLVPVLADSAGVVICGHGRVLAARHSGLTEAPVIRVEHLLPAQVRAFQIADNRLTENSEWDKRLLGEALRDLSLQDLDFSLEITGFEIGEIDIMIADLDLIDEDAPDADDEPVPPGPLVTRPGDLWEVLGHRILCDDALSPASFETLLGSDRVGMTFTDPPYNVAVQGHVGGRGKIKHEEFAMASGEMSAAEFTAFLMTAFTRINDVSAPGSLVYACMDWRHLPEVIAAGRRAFDSQKNICVWAKTLAGQGAFYRSQHEMVLVFAVAGGPVRNNIQLGKFGRNRSNLWTYPSPASFGHAGEEGSLLKDHPTPKPVAMVADAILDCTTRGDLVLDPFMGGGATLVAAERTGRFCRAIEIEPKYVDAALRRLQRTTGEVAVRVSDGGRFDEIEQEERDHVAG